MTSASLKWPLSAVRSNDAAMRYIVVIAWCAIVCGIVLRLTQLPTRAVYHDEFYTQFRVAGHSAAELMDRFYHGQPFSPRDLRQAASVDSASSPQRLISSLATEDAQHPPLFYLAEFGLVKMLGNALVVWRLLPALFGILAIPAAYALARELFRDARTGLVAAAVFAVSPIERVYSDQAREYSLFVLLLLLATFAVVRAMRANTVRSWAFYGLTVAAGLYANPFMAYVMAAHALFALGTAWPSRRNRLPGFAVASALALATFAPWLYDLAVHRTDIADTNVWSATHWPFARLAAKWAFNTGSAFFDLEYIDIRWSAAFAVVALVAIVALVRTFRAADAEARWCLGAGILVPAILLIAPDLVLSQHRSAVARYGLPVLALLVIAVSRGLVRQPIAATVILAAGLGSCAIGAMHPSWWDNDTNADDTRIGSIISATAHAQVVSTIAPPEFINFAEVLADDVRISLRPDLAGTQSLPSDPLFAIRPSVTDLAALSKQTGRSFAAVRYPRTNTAHDIGTAIANKSDPGAGIADLYRAIGVRTR